MTKTLSNIAGKKCVIYADEQPQVLLIQPVGEHDGCARLLPAAILPDSARPVRAQRKNHHEGDFFFVSHFPDSNRGPTHYECVALPTEPKWQRLPIKTVVLIGEEIS